MVVNDCCVVFVSLSELYVYCRDTKLAKLAEQLKESQYYANQAIEIR